MIQAATKRVMQRGLPSLGGGLLRAYRLAWAALALSTLFFLGYAFTAGAIEPFVLAIRIVKSVILIAVAVILFCRRQRDPVAAILSLAFLCWTITSSVDFTSTEILPILLDRLRFLLFAWALLLFPDGKWRPRWTRSAAFASLAIFGIGAIEGAGLAQTKLYLPLAIACIVAAIASLVQRFRTTSSETQQLQLKWVAVGLVSGIGLILAARAGAALDRPRLGFEAMFQLGIIFVALGFLVPLLRYRLYDAEAFISRSAGYAILTATLVAVFAGSESLIENFGQQYLGSGLGQLSGAMAAAVAAFMLAPLNDRISTWAEHRFQRDLVHLKKQLPELLTEAPHRWTTRQIATSVLPHICEAVHATSAAIVLKDKLIGVSGATREEARRPSHFSLQLPLHCPFGGTQGLLLLGPRPDKSQFGKDDVEALETIVPALRRALIVADQREGERRREASERRSLLARIEQMNRQILALELQASMPRVSAH